jgi:nucleotide-binding universal stress UspA family protein
MPTSDAPSSPPPPSTNATSGTPRSSHDHGERWGKRSIEAEVRQLVRGQDVADDLIAVAEEVAADFIVIGLRRRSPVGKLILGSNAQRILLDAPCPVLAVKAEEP